MLRDGVIHILIITVFQILLATLLIVIFAVYFWKEYSPYFSFPNYFFFSWPVISAVVKGKAPGNKSVNAHLIHFLREIAQKHMSEEAMVLWFFTRPVLIVHGPGITKLLATERSLFNKPRWAYKFLDYTDEDGILRSTGKRAKQQRKLLGPIFFPRMMKNYVSFINDHSTILVHELRQLENQTARDVSEILKSRIIKMFYEAAFGIKTSSTGEDSKASTFIESTIRVFEFVSYRLYRPWLHPDFMQYFSSACRNHKKDVEKMHFVAYQIIEVMKERYALRNQSMYSIEEDSDPHEQSKKCFGDNLYEEHLKDPIAFTLRDLQTEIINLIVGGYDTSSTSLSWTLWLLGYHHDIQEKAYEEVKLLNSDFIDYDDANILTYVECIIKESFRLYPAVPVFGRLSSKDLYFKNYKIPRGTSIFFVSYLLHRHSEVFPEPEVFKPERFLENDVKPFTLMPFAESIRYCIGKNFAMLQLKVLLAYILRNFKIISVTPKEDVDTCWEVMLKSTVPLSVKFIPR